MLNYQKIIDLRNMYLIKNSGYFDDRYYKSEYPEVRGNRLKHYYYEGWKKGYNPSEKFDNDYYLSHNTDVGNAKINPLLHYIVSGNNEGRRIMRVFGIRLSTVYGMLYHHKYSYYSFLENTDKERLTIFYHDEKFFDCLLKIIQCCYKKIFIRIFYNDLNFDKFYHFVNENHIDISCIELLKWNNRYYLNVGLKERIICFDYCVLNCLLHTSFINKPIYFYVDNRCKDLEKNMWLSYYAEKKKIILISEKNIYLNKYQLVIHNDTKKLDQDIIKIGFQFDKISIEMLNVYQEYFLYQTNLNHYSFSFNASDFFKNICFDNQKSIVYQSSLDNVDVLVEFSYNNNCFSCDSTGVQIYFEPVDDKLKILSLDKIFFKEGVDDV